MGSGEIGVPTLRWLAGSGHELLAVYTQPDRPAGRGSVMTAPAIKLEAQALGLRVLQPVRLRHSGALEGLRALGADLIVVMAYGQLLPKAVLEAPRIACLNLHASILPKYRGAAPIQAAILAGDRETGITLMYMDEGLDTGDVLLIEKLALAEDETGGSLHDRLAGLGPVALRAGIEALCGDGGAARLPQDESLASHVGKLRRGDGRIDWTRSAQEIERMVRAYHPWPGTVTSVVSVRGGGGGAVPKGVGSGGASGEAPARAEAGARGLKILPPTSVEVVGEALGGEPGRVLRADRGGILVATGDPRRALRVMRVQPESKKEMDAAAYLAGRPFGIADGADGEIGRLR